MDIRPDATRRPHSGPLRALPVALVLALSASARAADSFLCDGCGPELAALSKRMQSYHSSIKALVGSGNAKMRNEPQGAVLDLSEALRLVAEARAAQSRALAAARLTDKDRQVLPQVLQAFSDEYQLYNLRAKAYNLLDKGPSAEADALKSLELHPRGNPGAYAQLARAQLAAKDHAAALVSAQKAIEGYQAAESKEKGVTLALMHQYSACAKLGLGRREDASVDINTAYGLDRSAYFARLYDDFYAGRPVCDLRASEASPLEESPEPWRDPRVWAVAAAALVLASGWAYLSLLGRPEPEAAAPVPAAPALDGRLAGKYQIVRVIGKGGMGAVYEAVDHALGRKVAIKKMSAAMVELGPQGREYFLKEARTVAALHHPSIVDIYAVLEEGPDIYLVFEFVLGKTVQQMLVESKRLSLDGTLEILGPICRALEFAHGRDMVHRDLKPANIMVTQEGQIKLMDFGIARTLSERPGADGAARRTPPPSPAAQEGGFRFDRTMTVSGTPLYMSPETEQGIVCKEADVYALGVCLYEMLTGEPPFSGPGAPTQKLDMDFIRPTARAPELPRKIDELAVRAMQPDPARRLKTPGEFLARLEDAAREARAAGAKP